MHPTRLQRRSDRDAPGSGDRNGTVAARPAGLRTEGTARGAVPVFKGGIHMFIGLIQNGKNLLRLILWRCEREVRSTPGNFDPATSVRQVPFAPTPLNRKIRTVQIGTASMRPRHFAGESCVLDEVIVLTGPASMRPRHFAGESLERRAREVRGADRASMRPRHFAGESSAKGGHKPRDFLPGFNEAPAFRRGKSISAGCGPLVPPSFNEAPAFRRGKCGGSGPVRGSGCCFNEAPAFRRGKFQIQIRVSRPLRKLQ